MQCQSWRRVQQHHRPSSLARPERRRRRCRPFLSAFFWYQSAVSARGRVAAWARAVQAAPPGWECSPWARRLCCTTYPGLPASSARSGRPMPHRSPGYKHPLTDADPPLKRARGRCAFKTWLRRGWADNPRISTEQCPPYPRVPENNKASGPSTCASPTPRGSRARLSGSPTGHQAPGTAVARIRRIGLYSVSSRTKSHPHL